MALPIAICGQFNADFDGDTMSIHLVPPEIAEETYNAMSPRYVNVYKKSNEPIYAPNHETLNGLAVASEVVYDDPKELEDPKHYYTDYAELLRDVEINKTIKIGTPIVFTGKIGSEDYQNKITTYFFQLHQEGFGSLLSSFLPLEWYNLHYLRFLTFLLAILIPTCDSSSPAFHMMYSIYKSNKQGDSIWPCTPFPSLNHSVVPCTVLTVAS